MKILQLNVWMGKVEGKLQRFLEQNDFDVICLQEVMASENCTTHVSRLCFDLSRIQRASGLEHVYFAPTWSSDIATGSFECGNAILSRIPFIDTKTTFVHGEFCQHVVLGALPKNQVNVQVAKLENGVTIANHHGYWHNDPIGTEQTVAAFTKLATVIRDVSGPLVLCGDFNVIHESPAMRPLDFLRDLTAEQHVRTTLSGLKYDGEVACDHIMVNDEITVQSFAVLPDVVSDHLALCAEVEPKK